MAGWAEMLAHLHAAVQLSPERRGKSKGRANGSRQASGASSSRSPLVLHREIIWFHIKIISRPLLLPGHNNGDVSD